MVQAALRAHAPPLASSFGPNACVLKRKIEVDWSETKNFHVAQVYISCAFERIWNEKLKYCGIPPYRGKTKIIVRSYLRHTHALFIFFSPPYVFSENIFNFSFQGWWSLVSAPSTHTFLFFVLLRLTSIFHFEISFCLAWSPMASAFRSDVIQIGRDPRCLAWSRSDVIQGTDRASFRGVFGAVKIECKIGEFT